MLIMPQSPQHRPLVQNISLEHLHKTLHYNTCTKYITRTLEQSTSLEHSHSVYIYLYVYTVYIYIDRLCGLVVRVLGYRFGGPGFDSQALNDLPTKKKKRKTSSGSGTGFTQPREYN
jgi:hypothetical protein